MSVPAAQFRSSAERSGDILVRLRHETAEAHQRLETDLDLLGGLDRARMIRVLERFLGFYRGWEPVLLERFAEEPGLVQPRRRQGYFEADLVAMGVPRDAVAVLPECDAARGLAPTVEAGLGALYVMEGSTLGGQVIARHLAGRDWLPPGGLTGFTPYGAATATLWRALRERLNEAPPQAAPAIVAGAQRAFAVLHEWMRPGFAAGLA